MSNLSHDASDECLPGAEVGRRPAFLMTLIAVHAGVYFLVLAGSPVTMQMDVGLASGVLAIGLVTASVVDMRRHLIPDEASLGLVLAGLLSTWWFAPDALGWHALSALLWFAALALVSEAYFRLRGFDGFGLGDAKLMAAAASWLGMSATVGVLLIASAGGLAVAIGALFRRRPPKLGLDRTGIPFGPFIAMAVWVSWLYGPVV